MTLSLNLRRSVYAAGTMLALAANSERANADVVGPGQLTSTAGLSGTFTPGSYLNVGTQFNWNDQLFAIPGIGNSGDRILITVVLEGSNPTLVSGGTSTVNTRGILDFVTFQNLISSEIVVTDPQYARQTLIYSMPLYSLGFPADGNLTTYRMSLQSIAGLNVIGGTATGSTTSDFSAYLQNIRAVDAQGNDITSQIGLRSASGFMGSAPEPSTFVLIAGGLLLLPLVNSNFRKRLLSKSV